MDVQTILWLLFMIWNSITDIRKKKISLLSCLVSVVAVGILSFVIEIDAVCEFLEEKNWMQYALIQNSVQNSLWKQEENNIGFVIGELFFRSLPGTFLLVTSRISKNAIGAGDGLIVLITGWFLGAGAATEILFWSLLCSAVFGIVLIMVRKASRKTEIPFIPFLLLGYLVRLGLG